MSTAIAAIPINALATVDDNLTPTLTRAAEMTQLADTVIHGVKNFADIVDKIFILKEYFDTADRDSTNRLRIPIKECRTWQEFCEIHIGLHIRKIQRLLAKSKPKSQSEPRQLTDADVAAYEQEHPDIRSLTRKLLTQMNAADTVGALIGLETPPPIAEAIVRIVVAENSETPANDVPPPRDEDPTATAAASILALELTNLFKVGEVQRANDIGRFHVSIAVHGISEASVRKLAAFIGELA